MRRYKTLILPIILLTLLPRLAAAEVPELAPLNVTTRYDIALGAVPIGRLRVDSHEDRFGYNLTIDTKTTGLVNFFAPLKSVATTRGQRTEEGAYIPAFYDSKGDKDDKEKNKRSTITYDKDGQITTDERTPRDDPKWRPLVPREKTKGAVDPITGFFMLRKQLRDAMARGERETSVLTYDGARLAIIKIAVVSRAKIDMGKKHRDAINTVLTRTPITGYTPKEMKKYKAGDPVIHAYFSPDAEFMPLQISIGLPYGDVKATLTEYTKTN